MMVSKSSMTVTISTLVTLTTWHHSYTMEGIMVFTSMKIITGDLMDIAHITCHTMLMKQNMGYTIKTTMLTWQMFSCIALTVISTSPTDITTTTSFMNTNMV